MAKKQGKLSKVGSFRKALATYAGPGGGGGGDAATLNGNAGTFYLDRVNHTGSQLAATISDFAAAVLTAITGSPINFQNTISVTGKIEPAALTADTDDYNPTGLSTANIIFISATGNQDLTGIAAQGDGRLIFLQNHLSGGDDVKLKNNSASSLAANRFFLEGDITIKAGQGVTLIYSTSVNRWLVNQVF